MFKYKVLPLLGFLGLFYHGAKVADKTAGFVVDSAFHTTAKVVKAPVEGTKVGYKHELKSNKSKVKKSELKYENVTTTLELGNNFILGDGVSHIIIH